MTRRNWVTTAIGGLIAMFASRKDAVQEPLPPTVVDFSKYHVFPPYDSDNVATANIYISGPVQIKIDGSVRKNIVIAKGREFRIYHTPVSKEMADELSLPTQWEGWRESG